MLDSLLNSLEYRKIDLSLERIVSVLEQLNNPHLDYPIVHVAGTNGKGSVCAYLASILSEAGYRVGLYTSPHLVDWSERISINKKPISTEDLTKLVSEIIDLTIPLTQFEVITAASWLYFARNFIDIAVIEVGLGGRLDATNVVPNPLVTVITSISLDHTQLLGSTLADIAREKAGIIKAHSPVVVGQLPLQASQVVQQRATQLDSSISWIAPAIELNGLCQWQDIIYQLPLNGEVQLQNSALAIATSKILIEKKWQISDRAIIQGIASTDWPGRLQWLNWRGRTILIDGAHNPASAQALRSYVDKLNKPLHWIVGILASKDHRQILSNLLRPGDRLSLVPIPDNPTAELQELSNLAQIICPELEQIEIYGDLFLALEQASWQERLVIVTGSLYLVGYFLSDQLTQS